MDLDAFRWLLTDDGQQLLAQAAEAPDDELKAQAQLRRVATGSTEERAAHVAAALGQVTLRRKAAAQARRRRRPDVLHPRRARAGHPGHRGRPPGRAPRGRLGRVGDRPGLRHRRRPGRVRPSRDHQRRGRHSTRSGSRWHGPTWPPSGLPGAVSVADATTRRHQPLRRGVRRPGPPYRPGPDLLARRLDPALDLRGGAPAPRRLREGGAGHPARADPGRRGGRVGQRRRRGEGGRALVGPAGHHRAGGPP